MFVLQYRDLKNNVSAKLVEMKQVRFQNSVELLIYKTQSKVQRLKRYLFCLSDVHLS